MSVLRLKACVRLPLNQILKVFISSDFTFYYIYGDIYFSMVIAKASRIRMILRKTPLKVYNNFKSTNLNFRATLNKVFWSEVIKWLGNSSCLSTKSFSPQLCLGFVDDTTALLLHHALLIARYHIFGAKLMHHLPSLKLLIRNFLTCLEVERRFFT